jgi:toxin ParE1/3/4
MADYALAPDAVEDLEDIDEYTTEKWGPAKRDAYIRGLFDLFEELAAFPALGTARPEVAELVRSMVYEKVHIVFYEFVDDRCYILRVLHHSRDVAPELFPR